MRNCQRNLRACWRDFQTVIIFPSVPKPENIDTDKVDDHEEDPSKFSVLKNLRKIENLRIEEQIIKFIELVEMTQEQVLAMKDENDALEKALATEFPSVSGLGFRDCDLDIYVELGQNAKDETFYVKAGMWGHRFRTRKVTDILRIK